MAEFPSIRSAIYSIDLETTDPGLSNGTSSAITGGLTVLGAAVSDGDGSWYLPWCHETKEYLRDLLRSPAKLVNANTAYDLQCLLSEGVWDESLAKRPYGDVLINAALVNNNAVPNTMNLNGQAEVYGFEPKKEDPLREAAALLGHKPSDWKKHMAELPHELVSEYARHDAWLAVNIYLKQLSDLTEMKCIEVLDLEERLLPINVLAARKGLRVDTAKLNAACDRAYMELDGYKKEINRLAGQELNLSRDNATAAYFKNRLGLPSTSMDAKVLMKYGSTDPLVELYIKAKKLEKIRSTYLDGLFKDYLYGDRLYPNIRQTVTWDVGGGFGGATTGREIYAKPALTTIPRKDPEWGTLCRSLIIADDGCQVMGADFSQQEPRWIVHFACELGLAGASEVAQKFIDNPDEDWHGAVAQLAGCSRDMGKLVVLASAYMSGFRTIKEQAVAAKQYTTDAALQHAIDSMRSNMPFIRKASEVYQSVAARQGFIRTVSGRCLRFDMWEPVLTWDEIKANNAKGTRPAALTREKAEEVYFHGEGKVLQRAMTYKAMNNKVQGSAADESKKSKVDLYYNHGILVNLLIYDELLCTGIRSSEEVEAVKTSMLNAYPKAVPNRVDYALDTHWRKA